MQRLINSGLTIILVASVVFGQNNSNATAQSTSKTDIIKPGDNLVIQGIPSIPAELAEAVKKYTESIPVFASGWHPTRREMLVGKRSGNTAQVHLVSSPLEKPKQLTSFPDPVGGGSYQRKTGDYFVFAKATGGNEVSQLFRYDTGSGNVTRVTTDDKKRNGGGPWSNAGDRMVYTAVMTGAGSASESFKTELRVVNPADPQTDRLVANLDGVGWGPLDWSPDDKKLIVGQYVSANESYGWLLDLETGEKTLLTPKEAGEKVVYGFAQFSGDGKGLYLTTDKDSEFQRLVYMDLATKKMTPLTSHINWDVEQFELTEDGKMLAFITNEDGFSKLHLLDTATNKERQLPKLPGQVQGFDWHKTTNELALNISSYQTIADVYSLDTNTMKLTHWAKTELNGYDTKGLREPELVRWKSFDGKTISGFLNRPPAKFTGKRPVIINIHGGPEGQSTPGPLGRNAYYINELGVAVIYPNVRGSSGYGKTFIQLDNGFQREDSVKDIGALLDWIATQPDLDKNRVMVTGGSYGGYMTLAVATHYNDRICCSLDVVGISNFVTFLKNTETYRRDLRRVEYGDERDPKMLEFLTKISPLTNANKISKPLFVVQGKNDPRVPYTEAEQIVQAARKNNTPVWYLMANDEGHGFGKKNNQDYLFYATVLFVKEHLLK
ncbi:MAG: prolyl oligopeptidase family serine peptidase [Acidobacteriota bacterium]|nr:prolyl oligopeptidase family serine peptidase [Acidobacteriota bacterium]